jgi:Lon protease-like protein
MEESSYQTPSEIPAMTLRDVVFFPKAMMPLRIFEDRYRQMLQDVIAGNRIFAIVAERENLSPGEEVDEPPFEVATAGVIRVSKKNEDGTSFVLLQGIERLRVRHIVQEEPYRVLKVEPWETVVDGEVDLIRQELLSEMKTNKELGGEVTEDVLEYLRPLDDVVAFVDLAAFTLCKHVVRKQAMLEVQKISKRAQMLIDDLRRANKELKLYKDLLGDQPDSGSNRN